MAYTAKLESEKIKARLEKKRKQYAALETEIVDLELAFKRAESSELLGYIEARGISPSEIKKMLERKKGKSNSDEKPDMTANTETPVQSIDQVFGSSYTNSQVQSAAPINTGEGIYSQMESSQKEYSDSSHWNASLPHTNSSETSTYGETTNTDYSSSYMTKSTV